MRIAARVQDIGHKHEVDDDGALARSLPDGCECIGIRTYAVIRFYLDGIPEGTYMEHRIHSPGIWGVEVSAGAWSDSDTAHVRELEAEQLGELEGMLNALGFAREQDRERPYGFGHVLDTLAAAVTDRTSSADDAEALYTALKATGRPGEDAPETCPHCGSANICAQTRDDQKPRACLDCSHEWELGQ